ncbi:MAG: outer membrane beta-barrel protein [Candidatus Delongbacteria bacterium]|jgi:opacity protein-like surface antigen|nr:outer membrane beta-barrel protein [Candidatus Delongbacteria bacterium]
MKKLTMMIVLLAIMSMYAQGKIGAIKAGMFFPGACDGGFDLGIEYGMHIDTNLDVSLEMGWFKKDFEDNEARDDYQAQIPGLTDNEYEKLSETTIYDFPIMVMVTAKFPINFNYKWFASGGLGAEMLYASYTTYDDNDKSELAFDFNWRLGGGMIYNLGERSEVLAELTYHNSKPSYEYEENISGTDRTFTREYDMSGVMGRVGVRFFFN